MIVFVNIGRRGYAMLLGTTTRGLRIEYLDNGHQRITISRNRVTFIGDGTT